MADQKLAAQDGDGFEAWWAREYAAWMVSYGFYADGVKQIARATWLAAKATQPTPLGEVPEEVLEAAKQIAATPFPPSAPVKLVNDFILRLAELQELRHDR